MYYDMTPETPLLDGELGKSIGAGVESAHAQMQSNVYVRWERIPNLCSIQAARR